MDTAAIIIRGGGIILALVALYILWGLAKSGWLLINNRFGVGRAFSKLPPHNNFSELSGNIESFSNGLMNTAANTYGPFRGAETWQYNLGRDLQMLVDYARRYVPDDVDSLHYYRRTSLSDAVASLKQAGIASQSENRS